MKVYLGIGMNIIKFDDDEIELIKETAIELPKGILPIILPKEIYDADHIDQCTPSIIKLEVIEVKHKV